MATVEVSAQCIQCDVAGSTLVDLLSITGQTGTVATVILRGFHKGKTARIALALQCSFAAGQTGRMAAIAVTEHKGALAG